MSDLISREALLDTIRQKMFDTRYDIELAMDVIKTTPAVDAVPVVHGEIISHKAYLMCSACGNHFSIRMGQGNPRTWNWCPKCGAKMDGG